MKNVIRLFEKYFEMPFPDEMLPDCEVFPFTTDTESCYLFGSKNALKTPTLTQGDIDTFMNHAPNGYYMIGFWGHGTNSYAFYYVRNNGWRKILFRLGYGGAYMDNVEEAKTICSFLGDYLEFEKQIQKNNASIVILSSMETSSCEVFLSDGKEFKSEEMIFHRQPERQKFFNRVNKAMMENKE